MEQPSAATPDYFEASIQVTEKHAIHLRDRNLDPSVDPDIDPLLDRNELQAFLDSFLPTDAKSEHIVQQVLRDGQAQFTDCYNRLVTLKRAATLEQAA